VRRLPEIETARLRLRPYRERDVDALHALWTDPDVRRYLWDDKRIDREAAADLVRRMLELESTRGLGHFCLLVRDEERVVGFCGLQLQPASDEIELLYGIEPALWGRGLVSEAVQAVLRYGFEELGLERIIAVCDLPNRASVRVMENAGMTFERRWRGEVGELVQYAIRRDAFHAYASTYRLG
jgi:ribosomal-protein-alanine N-acetyltransferase